MTAVLPVLLPSLWPDAKAFSDRLPMIAGVDFSSTPTRKKPIRIAQASCVIPDGALPDTLHIHVTEVLSLDNPEAFTEWLALPQPWVAAFDMPFGLSRHIVDALGWPGANRYDESSWADCIRFYESLSREEIRQCFQAWCHAHPAGQKFAHRATDIPAKSSPSMKWVNPPVAYMLHAGAAALLRSGVSVPGCHAGDPHRIALEAYPGWLARQLIGAVSYKTDDVSKQNEARLSQRHRLCDALLHAPVMGIRMTVADDVAAEMRNDPKGDCLDAVMCCVQAAWAFAKAQQDGCWGLPPDADPLEGWIAAVPWDDATPRRNRLPAQAPEITREQMRSHLDAALQAKVQLFRGLPPGPNVGTQLKALRAKQRREQQREVANAADGDAEQDKPDKLVPPWVRRRLKPIPFNAASVEAWFASKGWSVFPFQQEVWSHMQAGRSGLLHATTGSGKTYAVWLGAMLRMAAVPRADTAAITRALWITPMRALAVDTTRTLNDALEALAPQWTVGLLTGDTVSAERARLTRQPPTALVTTPESLTLMLTRIAAASQLYDLDVLIVDEWHELLGNKRGVQLQLAIARLVMLNPRLVIWGLSATLGDLPHARDVLLQPLLRDQVHHQSGVLVQGKSNKKLLIDTLIPDQIERFPWGGHLGLRQVEAVARELDQSATTLIFTNTRSQAEIWYQALLEARPHYAGLLALHHGSLDKSVRDWVEQGLKQGILRAVVSTSSLDLGVDFLPVERVLQIGSPKGVARLLQRAGRSGHAPGRASRITIVPTHALELVEAAAARYAVEQGRIESRHSPDAPLDVLVQHIVSIAIGSSQIGFDADELFKEVKQTYAYRDLAREAFNWALQFVVSGGGSLTAYPEFHKVVINDEGRYTVTRKDIARRHVMSIGTIVSDASMHVAWMSGGRIGTIEESFIARLKAGDCFTFAGRVLELVRIRDMTAYVRKAAKNKGAVPQWQGGKMPLSSELAHASLQMLDLLASQTQDPKSTQLPPELLAIRHLADAQQRWSELPAPQTLLIERMTSKEGHHLFVYPFAGRTVHMGLASLLAYRAAKSEPGTFSIAMNDYGFELLSAKPMDSTTWFGESTASSPLFNINGLFDDVLASLNASELSQRRFREIARIAGLVFQGFPGAGKSAKQLQASSGLFYQVFAQHDRDNLLLKQAQREALQHELDLDHLKAVLIQLHACKLVVKDIPHPTPFAFPLMIERLRERVTTEKLSDRVMRMLKELEGYLN